MTETSTPGRAEAREARAQIERLEARVDGQRDSLREHMQMVRERDAEIARLREALTENERDFEAIQQSTEAAANAYNAARQEIARLTQERDALAAQIAGLREALARTRGRVVGVIQGDGIGLAYEAVDILSAALAAATAPEGGTK